MVYGCFDPKIRRLAFVASAITATASRWSLRDAFWGAMASNTSRRGVGQWGGAGGAIYEDHFALAGSVRVAAAVVVAYSVLGTLA